MIVVNFLIFYVIMRIVEYNLLRLWFKKMKDE
jgi:hypothetical protein